MEGGCNTCFFWNVRRTTGRIALKPFRAYELIGRPLRNYLGEPALVRSRSHDIIKWISISLFSTEILFSVTKLAAIDWNGGMRDLGQKTTISDLWYCILNFRWQTEVMTLAEPMLAYNGLISGLWGFLMSWYRVCSFFHTGLFIGPFHHFRCASIRAIDSVCHRAVFPMKVTWFLLGMLNVTNI